MPPSLVKSLAAQAGKSVERAEELWKKAKELAKKGNQADNYAYIVGIFKKSLGLSKAAMQEFVESNKVIFTESEYRSIMNELKEETKMTVERYKPIERLQEISSIAVDNKPLVDKIYKFLNTYTFGELFTYAQLYKYKNAPSIELADFIKNKITSTHEFQYDDSYQDAFGDIAMDLDHIFSIDSDDNTYDDDPVFRYYRDKSKSKRFKYENTTKYKPIEKINEKELTTAEREALPDSAFVFPIERKYPIHDRAHAQNALARVAQHGTPEEKKKVRAAVNKKYPDMIQEESTQRYKPIERLQEDFSKKVFIGSADKSTIYLGISVKMKEKAIDWETLQPVENRDVVSISGNIGKHSAGQINDTLMELYKQGKLSLSIDEDDFLTLMKIWDKYHLNDLIPGTKEQMSKIKELHNAGFDTSAKCNLL